MSKIEAADTGWDSLIRTGGAAALIAGIVFRRNLGVEIALFSTQKPPEAVSSWFTLLQTHRFLGLAYLNIFDLANYVLVGLMFLALYVLLRRANPGAMRIAAALGFLGVGVYAASNTALSMLCLSDQYAAAADPAQRDTLLAAGQALLALNRFSSPGAHPGSGGYASLLLVAGAGLLASVAMLRSCRLGKAAAIVGVLANALDLAYCAAFIFASAAAREPLTVTFIPAAGLFLMVWHILVGWRLLRLGRLEGKPLSQPA